MKNILISCISLFDRKKTLNDDGSPKPPIEYITDNISVTALQTNEACAKYLLKMLDQSGGRLNEYIRVQSPSVKQDEFTMRYLDSRIEEFCGENAIPLPHRDDVCLSKEAENEHRYDEALSEVSQKILGIAETAADNRVAIYLDMAGGKRDHYVFIQLLTKLLSFYGHEIHAYYADITGEKQTIVNTDLSFEHMKILDAVNEFVCSGSASALRKCFKDTQSRTVKDLLKVMEEFSDAIQLCSIKLGDTLLRLNQQLDQTEQFVTDDKEGLFIVKTMIPLIRSKFNIKSDDSFYATLGIVKWCLENNLIQQALTIYRENAAEIIISKKFVEMDKKIYGRTINKMMDGRHISKKNETELFCVLGEAFQNMCRNPAAGSKETEDGIRRYIKNYTWKKYDKNGMIICRDMEWTIGAVFFSDEFMPNGVKLNISTELFRRIVSDYRFATSARNRVNHASGKDSYDKLLISLFSLQGYPFSSYPITFTPKNVKKDLLRAVNNLETALKIADERKEQLT